MQENKKEIKQIGKEVIITKVNVEKIDKGGVLREIDSINYDLQNLKEENERLKKQYLTLINDKKELEDILKEIEKQENEEFKETLKSINIDGTEDFELEF